MDVFCYGFVFLVIGRVIGLFFLMGLGCFFGGWVLGGDELFTVEYGGNCLAVEGLDRFGYA